MIFFECEMFLDALEFCLPVTNTKALLLVLRA